MGRVHSYLASFALVGAFAVSSTSSWAEDWSGAYVGVNAGFAWGNSNATTATDCPATAPPGYVCGLDNPASLVNLPVVDAAGSGTMNPAGLTGGLQAG